MADKSVTTIIWKNLKNHANKNLSLHRGMRSPERSAWSTWANMIAQQSIKYFFAWTCWLEADITSAGCDDWSLGCYWLLMEKLTIKWK